MCLQMAVSPGLLFGILRYVVTPSFFFTKWDHMYLNNWYFLFYKHLREGGITKYRENRTLQKKWQFIAWNDVPVKNYKSDLAIFFHIGRYQGYAIPSWGKFRNFHLFQFYSRLEISQFVQKIFKIFNTFFRKNTHTNHYKISYIYTKRPKINRRIQIAKIIIVHKTIPSTWQTNTQQISRRTCPVFVKTNKKIAQI